MNDSEPSLRIHLGCWKRYLPGFVHVDLCDFPHIDYRHDIATLPMFADGSAELVYASHCLEYFDREQAREVLREWGRVLRPGGILRVAVPDFPALVKVYEATGDIHRILGPLYGRMEIQEGEGRFGGVNVIESGKQLYAGIAERSQPQAVPVRPKLRVASSRDTPQVVGAARNTEDGEKPAS